MDKQTFDIINQFYLIENDIYFRLTEKGMPYDDVDELLDKSVDYREKLLRIGKYLVEDEYVNVDTMIVGDYENIEKYTKLNVIYEYENGMALCESTASALYLVPQELLEYKKTIDVTKETDIIEEDENTEYVVSYLSANDYEDHIIFCDSKKEAEQKAEEVKALAQDGEVKVETREEYEELELESLDIE